jgi:hypothetical protein
MSSVQIQGNVGGTGVLTIAAPNTNTNRTLTLPDATGTFITTASTGKIIPAAALPAGTVLQVVQATTSTVTSTTTASFTDATNLAATITPSSSTNKILVLCDISVYIQADNATTGGVQIVRGSTAIYTDTTAVRDNVNANVAFGTHIAFNYLDSPSTTSATTYKIQIQRTSTAGTSYAFQVNVSASSISSITLMEIAA